MDSDQLTIDDALKSHVGDPPAAKQAARAAKARAGATRTRILAHLDQEQAHGATFREAAAALGLDVAEANRRLSDLFTEKLIARLAETRRSTRGAAGHVYVRLFYVRGRPTA